MDSFTTGVGGIVLGWLLSQGGFFFQRRVSLRGEVSKAAYFLLLALDELDVIIEIKEGTVAGKEFSEKLSVKCHSNLIGRDDFYKEAASVSEKVSMINIKMLRMYEECVCLLIWNLKDDKMSSQI